VQVSSPSVVGRARELSVLEDALQDAAAGAGGTVFISADAGFGKSRLVRECIKLAAGRGMIVLRGRATPAGATVPFRPLTEALFSLVRTGAVPQDPELSPYRPALGRLIPEWRDGESYGSDTSPVVLAESVLRLLGVVGRGRGALMCLSDLQDCDAETMDIIEYLVDNLADQPVLLLASMRSVPSPALNLAQSSARHRVARLLVIPPLTDGQIGELAAGCLGVPVHQVPEGVEPWLARIADGNPFVVEELLRSMIDSGTLIPADDGWRTVGGVPRDVPSTVAAGVLDRARRLGPQGQRALEAAAIVGRRFPSGVLQRITGMSDDEVHGLVRAATEAQLLEPARSSPLWHTFRNTWTAEALASAVPPAERRDLAAAAAEAVASLSPELSGELCQLAAALRLEAGDGPGAGMLYARAGRRALAEGAAASAERLLEQALNLLPVHSHPAERADALAALLYALTEAGDIERALRLGADLYGSVLLSPGQRAELQTRLAWVCVVGGHWEKAAQQVALARRLLAESSSSDAHLAPLDVVEAHLLTLGDVAGEDRAARAEALALRAVRIAEQVPLPSIACQARQVLALLARRSDFDAADVHLRHMFATADAHGLPIWRLRAQIRLAANELMRTGDAEQILLARRAALDLGAITAGAQADATVAMQQVLYGEFEQADALADRLLETSTRMHQDGESQFCLVIKIAAAAHQGRREAMRLVLAQFRDRGGEQSFHAPVVFGHRAICALLGEDRPGAQAEMARAREWERTHPTIYYQSGRYGLDLLLEVIARRAGRERLAEVGSAAAAALRWNRQFVLAAEAVLLGQEGDASGAGEQMAEALAQAAPFPMARHLLLRLVGEAALADGWGEPVDWLRAAEQHFHGADVAAIAGACRALLRKAGVRVMQRRSGLDAVPARLASRGVTVREFEVLTLLGERRGNPEIARLLFISPRTVEKHVASLMDKLGRADRGELSALATEL
jgi:DNA-binding CsgD family transcriptional regulator